MPRPELSFASDTRWPLSSQHARPTVTHPSCPSERFQQLPSVWSLRTVSFPQIHSRITAGHEPGHYTAASTWVSAPLVRAVRSRSAATRSSFRPDRSLPYPPATGQPKSDLGQSTRRSQLRSRKRAFRERAAQARRSVEARAADQATQRGATCHCCHYRACHGRRRGHGPWSRWSRRRHLPRLARCLSQRSRRRIAASWPGFRGGVSRRGSGFHHPISRPRSRKYTPHPFTRGTHVKASQSSLAGQCGIGERGFSRHDCTDVEQLNAEFLLLPARPARGRLGQLPSRPSCRIASAIRCRSSASRIPYSDCGARNSRWRPHGAATQMSVGSTG